MRPWIKMLSICGVTGVALGVSLAGDGPADRPASPARTNRPVRLEFIGRETSTSGMSAAPYDQDADLVAEQLAVEVSATPKRFNRTKTELSDVSASDSSTRFKLKSINSSNRTTDGFTELKPVSSSSKTSLRTVTNDVEFLSPPSSSDESDQIHSPTNRNRPSKESTAGIQTASFSAPVVDHAESTDGLSPTSVPRTGIQQANASQRSGPLKRATDEPAQLEPGTRAKHTSISTDRSPNSSLSGATRPARPVSTIDRMSFSKMSMTAGTPSVSVEWVKRSEINVGQECHCDLVVKNSGRVPAQEVVVDAIFPSTVRLTHADPEPDVVSDHLEWSIPELAAGEEQTIHITMIPSQRGELATTANVRFTGTAASVFKVEEPLLKVTAQSPSEAIVGDPLVQTVTITNPGTGVARNVRIQFATSEGLESTRGDRSTIEIGSLNPGASRSVRLSFTAIAGGEQTLQIEATADSGLNHAAEATVNVIAPSLKIAIEPPGEQCAGHDARYTLIITNDGLASTNNVRVVHRIPKGFTFLKADKGGSFDMATNSVNWFVGHLEPDQSIQLKLQLQTSQVGQFLHQVVVTAENGVSAKADSTTNVEGSASLALEIHDLEDPVEIGLETAYEVRITNSGAKSAENVGLTFELPRGIELLSVQSATQHFAKNGLILFNDLPELAPGKTALYRIHVRGELEGTQRVRARVTSESIERELITEEQTKFNGE